MTQVTHNEAIACCPNGGAWYLRCGACGRVGIMATDATCRFCGASNEPRETSREEFEKRTKVRF